MAALIGTSGASGSATAGPERDVAARVEALVQTTIDHVAEPASAAGFVKGAQVIGIHANVFEFDTGKITGGEHDMEPIDFVTHGKLWPMLFGKEAPAGARKLGKVTVVVDAAGTTAWFMAPLELPGKRAMHVSGVALLQGKSWALRVLDAELAVPDAELRNYPVLAPRMMMKPATPSTKLGKAIVSWFKDRSIARHAASGVVLAGGSAPAELASGAAAIKFAAVLDRLELVPIAVEAPDGAAVAIGTALLPISKQERDGEVEFGFTVYAVQEKGEWRWRSIQFAGDQVPARE